MAEAGELSWQGSLAVGVSGFRKVLEGVVPFWQISGVSVYWEQAEEGDEELLNVFDG